MGGVVDDECAVTWMDGDGVFTCGHKPTFDVQVELDAEHCASAEVCASHLGVTIRKMLMKHGRTCCHVEQIGEVA